MLLSADRQRAARQMDGVTLVKISLGEARDAAAAIGVPVPPPPSAGAPTVGAIRRPSVHREFV